MAQKKSCRKRTHVARIPDPRPATEPRDVVATIRGAELAIVDAIIEVAKQGSYQHAKFLFDYAGLSHQPGPEQSEPSLAQVLLERLGLEEELEQERENAVTTVTSA